MKTLWPDLPVEERLRRKFEMEQAGENHKPVDAVEVISEAQPIPTEKLPKTLKGLVAMLPGREIQAKHSRSHKPPTLYKTGDKAGEVRYDAKDINHYAFATVDKRYPVVYAVYSDGGFDFGWFAVNAAQRTFVQNVTTMRNLLKEVQVEAEGLV